MDFKKITENPRTRDFESGQVDGIVLLRKEKPKEKQMNTKSWKQIKDDVYGKKGTSRRDELDREFETFKVGLLLKKARLEKNLTQEQLANVIEKKRAYISRVESDGSNITLKTLYDIVEKGLGGKVNISIEV